LEEHHCHGESNAAKALFDRPAVDKHAGRDHDAHERESAVESILRDPGAAFLDVFLNDKVCISSAEERAEDISATRSEIEKTGLDWCFQVESRVENVTNGCEQRVHVPNQCRRGQCDHYEVGILPETDYTPGITHFPHDGSFPSKR